MEQLVIIAIVGIISLVNWLIKRSAEIREERRLERKRQGFPEGDPFHAKEVEDDGDSAPQVAPAGNQSDIRRLLEALGLPVDGEISADKEEIPQARPFTPSTPPPPPPPLPQPLTKSAPPRSEKPETPVPPRPKSGKSFARALHSQEAIRQAIVLREILGPPKAFTS